jgi:uncharacterized protein (DUF433 family)
MEPTLLAPHVDSHPDKCGGKPCVAGTRVRVWDVAHHIERLGYTPDEVICAYPRLSLSDVYGAMAYYWDHREEIERQVKEADARVEEWIAEHGHGPLGDLDADNTQPSAKVFAVVSRKPRLVTVKDSLSLVRIVEVQSKLPAAKGDTVSGVTERSAD